MRRPRLTVVLPAYNEEDRIERGLRAVRSHLEGRVDFELIVVDDGSTDRTGEILERLVSEMPALRTTGFPSNRGKGAAVREGVLHASGERILFTDVDQSTPISEWSKLAAAIDEGHDVALASREIVGARRVVPQPVFRRAMGYAFMVLRDLLVLPGFIDTQCGFKLFRREVAKQVFSRCRLDGFCFDVEVLAIAAHLGYRIIEVPVRWTDDPRSKVAPVRDSLRMFHDLFRIRGNRSRGLYDGARRG